MYIFFDIDDTLMNHRQAEKDAVLSFHQSNSDNFPVDPLEFLSQWHVLAEYCFDRYLKGDISFQEQRILRIKGLYDSFDQSINDSDAELAFAFYLKEYEKAWTLFSDVIDCLEGLSDYSLGIISNGNAQQQCKKLTLLSIENYFEEIIISSDAGFSKPDVRIFEAAFEKSGISAKDCVYIGDRLETDAIAASNAGMRGVWLNRGNYQNSKEIEIISSLSEVSNLIGK